MSLSPLIIAGTLLVAPSHPALMHGVSSALWFSNAKLLEAVPTSGGRVALRAKAEGILFASGLRAGEKTPLRIQVLTDADFEAFERCPKAPVDLQHAPPRAEPSDLLVKCGFKNLSVTEDQEVALEESFLNKEKLLSAVNPVLGRARWQDGQRELPIGSLDPAKLRSARKLLGNYAPFFKFTGGDGAKPGRTLIFRITLFEFSRSKAEALGVRWPGSAHVGSLDAKTWRLGTGEMSEGVEIGADFGESLGVGKILAEPQIRTKPGERAVFQSGGEIPIRDRTIHSATTTWKNYGLLLSLEPDANIETAAAEISVGFKVELSEPDSSTALDGVPGMTVRRLESRFDLRINENTILTTMIQSRSGATKNGLKGLMHLPFIGALLSDRQDHAEDSELCFSIRPSWEEISPSGHEAAWL